MKGENKVRDYEGKKTICYLPDCDWNLFDNCLVCVPCRSPLISSKYNFPYRRCLTCATLVQKIIDDFFGPQVFF